MKQKNLISVVTDHQITADTIAKAIGANEKHDGYYLGNGYAVTWTNGQLVEATFSPQESFVLSTTMESRLAYAHNFKFAMRDYDELVGYKKSAEDTRQLETIKSLWKRSATVVNAMHPDITGDLDFLSLYYFIASPVETRRAWLPVLKKKAIVHAVNHGPQNRKEYEKWLEESIYNALVKAAEECAELKGAPTVEEIAEAEAAVDAECAGVPAPAAGERREGDSYIGLITDRCPLFNLPALMIQAACELGYDHEKTILTAYRLYAKKLISYPMVMQNTVPGGVWKAMLRNMEMLRYNSRWGRSIPEGKPSKCHNFRNGETVYNGFGIVTTGLHPTDLSRDEEKLYNLIVKRVIDAFAPDSYGCGRKSKGGKKKSRRYRKEKKAKTVKTA
ncbi:MAG: DNA topoisomerase [Lepagella sp.]